MKTTLVTTDPEDSKGGNMSPRQKSKTPLRAMLLGLMVLPPIAVVASLSWLQEQSQVVVFLLTGIAGALTIIASFWLAILYDRTIDEWQRSNARFSSHWGWTMGASLVALILAIPYFRDWMVSITASVAKVTDPNEALVILAFTLGFAFVVLAQGICTVLLSIGWAVWKSRSPREAQ